MGMRTNAKPATAHKTDLVATMCIVPYCDWRDSDFRYVYDIRVAGKYSVTPEDKSYATLDEAVKHGRIAADELGIRIRSTETEGDLKYMHPKD